MSATRLAEINEQLQVLFRQKDQIDAQIIKLNKESDKIREKDWNERTDYTIADLLNGAPNSAKRQRELLRDVLLPYHLRAQGYYAETLQTGISVTMFRDDSDLIVREVAAGLDMLLDWMKPIDKHRFDIDGPVIVFDIFEHTLSEGGSFNLAHLPESVGDGYGGDHDTHSGNRPAEELLPRESSGGFRQSSGTDVLTYRSRFASMVVESESNANQDCKECDR